MRTVSPWRAGTVLLGASLSAACSATNSSNAPGDRVAAKLGAYLEDRARSVLPPDRVARTIYAVLAMDASGLKGRLEGGM
jgi:hypothetical protein